MWHTSSAGCITVLMTTSGLGHSGLGYGRCFRSVDSSSDGSPKCVAMDTEPTHAIMPRCRFGQTDRTTHETLEPRPHMDVFAGALLRMGCAKRGLRGLVMPLVGAPAIGREAGEVTRGHERLPGEKPVLLPSPTDRRQHCPPVMIKRMPEPPRLGLLADRTPHCIAFGGPPAAVLQR